MKFHLLWALLALTLLVATSYAQPPACVGDQCVSQSTATSSQVVVVQRSILKSHVFLPRLREVAPARKLAGATLKTGKAIVGFSGRVVKAALPPYPRVRQRLAGRFGR